MSDDTDLNFEYPGRWAAEAPDRPAVVMAETGETMTFAELDAEANRISRVFHGLGIGPGDEVLCPSFTFFATAGAIARTGATPVFVDSTDTDFNIDLAAAAGRVTDKTKAIIPVHLFGQAADMDGVQRLAKEHDLAVLEDAAQSMGATFGGQPVGTMGDLGAFSFFPSKNLGGFGDGGMITTDDDGLAKRARILRVHGGAPKYYHKAIGGNFRMDPLHAALLRVKLGHFPGYLATRRANAAQYLEHLGKCDHVAEGRLVLPTEVELSLIHI